MNKEFLEWLEEEIKAASDTAQASRSIAQNSYGAGYDTGYFDALITARSYFIAGDGT